MRTKAVVMAAVVAATSTMEIMMQAVAAVQVVDEAVHLTLTNREVQAVRRAKKVLTVRVITMEV